MDALIRVREKEAWLVFLKDSSGIRKFREILSIDLLIYTRAMFDVIKKSPNNFLNEITQKGKVLYETFN